MVKQYVRLTPEEHFELHRRAVRGVLPHGQVRRPGDIAAGNGRDLIDDVFIFYFKIFRYLVYEVFSFFSL